MKSILLYAGVLLLAPLVIVQVQTISYPIVSYRCLYDSMSKSMKVSFKALPSSDGTVIPKKLSSVKSDDNLNSLLGCFDDIGDLELTSEINTETGVITPACDIYKSVDDYCWKVNTQKEPGFFTREDPAWLACCNPATAMNTWIQTLPVEVSPPDTEVIESIEATLFFKVIEPQTMNEKPGPLSINDDIRLLICIDIKKWTPGAPTSIYVYDVYATDESGLSSFKIIDENGCAETGRNWGYKATGPFEATGNAVTNWDALADGGQDKELHYCAVSTPLDVAKFENSDYVIFNANVEVCNHLEADAPINSRCFVDMCSPGRKKRDLQNTGATTLRTAIFVGNLQGTNQTSGTIVGIQQPAAEGSDCFQSWVFVVVVVVLVLLLVLTVLVSFFLLFKLNKKKDYANEKTGYVNHGMAA